MVDLLVGGCVGVCVVWWWRGCWVFFCCWFMMDLWVVIVVGGGGGCEGVCGTNVIGWWHCLVFFFFVSGSQWICGLTSGSDVCGAAVVGW